MIINVKLDMSNYQVLKIVRSASMDVLNAIQLIYQYVYFVVMENIKIMPQNVQLVQFHVLLVLLQLYAQNVELIINYKLLRVFLKCLSLAILL